MSEEIVIEGISVKSSPQHLKNDPCSNTWTTNDGAVLLLNKIKEYCDNPTIKLIAPYDNNLLEPASYKLRLGDEYRVDGINKKLTDDDPILTIEPHGIAIVRTYEWINMPGFLIARWNLKVKKVYQGLVWVGGSQVDPGYQGFLPCPLYNLSNKQVKLEYKKPLFTIDFVRTTVYDESKGCRLWQANPTRNTASLGALDTDKVKSAVKAEFAKIENDVTTMKDELRSHGRNMSQFQTTTFTVLAIIITAVTVLATLSSLETIKVSPDWTELSPNWISILAFLVSIFAVIVAWGRSRRKN